MSYDGFISYSHAADDLLAPRLQAGLQRFAKPWWQRRALRLFRDEASLSANPHLWSSITEALDGSEWFVLLLSPDAAASPWVDREVAYWLEHKDASRIIPVLTDGEFTWMDGIVSDAVPPSLTGAFADEPRWVDLRFAKGDEQLDLNNPAFAFAVADIASALRGIPKDELESEEVKQHRRTIRTAWAAGLALLILAFASALLAIQASQQRDLAEANAAEARANADAEAQAREEADRQRDLAEANEARATESEGIALAQAASADARRLLSAGRTAVDEDPELTILLTLSALRRTADDSSIKADAVEQLVLALGADRLIARFMLDQPQAGAISPDGSTIYYVSAAGSVSAVSVPSADINWSTVPHTGSVSTLEVSPLGTMLVVRHGVADPFDDPGHGTRLLVLDASDGAVIHDGIPGDCAWLSPWSEAFSPDGRFYSVYTGTSLCGGFSDADWADIYDTATWEVVASIKARPVDGYVDPGHQLRPGAWDGAVFSADSNTLMSFGFSSEATIYSFPALVETGTHIQTTGVAINPAGTHLAAVLTSGLINVFGDPIVIDFVSVDSEDPTRVTELELDGPSGPNAWDEPMSFSPGGGLLAVSTDEYEYVFTNHDGPWTRFLRLLNDGPTQQHSWTADSRMLLTISEGGVGLLWDMSRDTSVDLADLPTSALRGLTEFSVSRLSRGFTSEECQRYALSPCPSLDDMRSG